MISVLDLSLRLHEYVPSIVLYLMYSAYFYSCTSTSQKVAHCIITVHVS